MAAEAKLEAYLAGGTVRDLVLGATPRDPDLVIVGQATTYAVRLAEALGGDAGTPSEFGTITVTVGGRIIDIATARSETYDKPGALPTVSPSDIETDLRRRDFTVNAMAISIMPGQVGRLVDPSNGFSDCARRRLRILHPGSFADDPTRAIRAVRYMVRLGFELETATSEAMERDLHFMDAVSGPRIRAELEKLLSEPNRVEMIRLADRLGTLAAIAPTLRPGSAGLAGLEKVGDGKSAVQYFAYLVAGLTENESKAVIERLDPPREWREIIAAGHRYRAIATILDRTDLSPSEIVELLSPFPLEALKVQQRLAPPTPQRKNLQDYMERHRHVKTELTGHDVMAAGVPEGPRVGELLKELRAARLDGKVHSRDEELGFVKRRLSAL
jgi:tRNA nucleotidyltransferase (CCA-adding enzyme)